MLRVPVTLVAFIVFGSFAAPCSGCAQAAVAAPSPLFAAESIADPSLAGMTAFSVRIPSGWQLQSAVLPPVDCNFASAVFRAYSRDGLTDLALLPMLTWAVTKPGSPAYAGGHDVCLHMDHELTAKDFLDRFMQTLDSPTMIGPMSIAPAYQKQFDAMLSNLASQNSQHAKDSKDPKDSTFSFVSKVTGDVAAVRIETLNGTFRIEERLRARVWCMHTTYATKPDIETCFARVDVLRAPKGKLGELITLVDDNNLMDAPPDPKWVKMQLDRLSSTNPWGSEAVQPYVRMQAAVVNCQATALGIRVLDDPSVFQHPFDRDPMEPIRFSQRIANPSPSNVFDWADLVLNFTPGYRYGNRCSGSSLIRKWSNETGQWYRTANVYANPNGALPGVWTDTTVAANPSPQ